jgi:methionyl-tRNA formyltransferase
LIGNGQLSARLAEGIHHSRHDLIVLAEDGVRCSSLSRLMFRAGLMPVSRPDTMPHWACVTGAPLLYLDELNGTDAAALQACQPDLLLVGGFSRRLPEPFLRVAPLGAINCHPSLLPRHRGPDPIAAAILSGDHVSGLTFHVMEQRFDSGPVLADFEVAIDEDWDWPRVCEALCDCAGNVVGGFIDELEAGTLEPQTQDPACVTHAPMLKEADRWLDWRHAAVDLKRRVRALAGAASPRFRWEGRAVYVREVSVLSTSSEASPGTLTALRPRPCVATGKGILCLHDPMVLYPFPAPWPAPWSRLRVGDRLPTTGA